MTTNQLARILLAMYQQRVALVHEAYLRAVARREKARIRDMVKPR